MTDSKAFSDVELEIHKLMYDEWKFRLTNLWSLFIKLSFFCIVIIIIPIAYQKYVDTNSTKASLYLFPAIGSILAIALCVFATLEMRRIVRLKEGLKKSVMIAYPRFKISISKKNWVHHNIPICFCLIKLMLAALVVYIT